MSTTTQQIQALHDHYVEAVNMAVAEDDLETVERLAHEFDIEAARIAA